MLQRFLWLLPFIAFVAGYYSIGALIGPVALEAPALRGHLLRELLPLLARYPLKIRILDCIEEATLPEGTVINQYPNPGQTVKLYQPVSIVVSKKPPLPLAPSCYATHQEALAKQMQDYGFRLKLYPCESTSQPVGHCIAQFPAANAPMENKTLIVYVSSGKAPIRIMPDLSQRPYSEVSTFLKEQGLTTEVSLAEPLSTQAEPNTWQNYIITAQQPLAGSFIDILKPPVVQLHLSKPN